MAISYIGCNQSSGTSLAAATASDLLAQVTEKAFQVTDLVQQFQGTVSQYDLPKPSISVPFDSSGQLDDWPRPDRPDLDYGLLAFNAPDAPANVQLNDLSDVDLTTYLPLIPTALVDKTIDKLCDIIEGRSQIMPIAFEHAVYERSRDRVHKEASSARIAVIGEFSRRNMPISSGTQMARLDTIDQAAFTQLAGVSRDIAIEIYRQEAQLYLAALQLAQQFYAVWGQIYAAWIDAQSRRNNFEAQENAQRLQRLSALIQIFEAQSNNERSRLASVAQSFGTEAQVFSALVQEGDAISRKDAANKDLQARLKQSEAQVKSTAAENEARELTTIAGIETSLLTSILGALSQIGAAFTQAINVGSTMSSSSSNSESRSCASSESYTEVLSLST